MWRSFVGVLVTLALGGCVSSVLIGPLPTVSDPTHAAEIVVIREHRFTGSGRTDPITLDGVEIYHLRVGEHVVMKVNPGDHIVGIRYRNITFLWEEVTVLVRTEQRQSYYFRIDPGYAHPLVNAVTLRRDVRSCRPRHESPRQSSE